uniref:Uncharacterized protein n=1 Tax=viral metagenome TaxID=1070528 RepID=A0A6C0D6Y0_9ZZZZ
MDEYYIIFTSLLIFAVAPFAPDVFYNYFVDTYVGIFILLCISLYSITYGYLPAVTVFTAVAGLYAESHTRKANKVRSVDASNNVLSEAVKNIVEAPKLVSSEVHPPMEMPDGDVVTFTPKDSEQTNEVNKSESINEKEALPTISLSKDAEAVYEQNSLAEKLD